MSSLSYPGMGGAPDYPGVGGNWPENLPAADESRAAPSPSTLAAGVDERSPCAGPDGGVSSDPLSPDTARVAGAGELAIERIPAAEDTDTLTRQTVAKMCEYIAAGAADPAIKFVTDAAVHKLSNCRRDPFSLAWAVYWFVKHRVRRAMDEAALFRLGEPDQADMLIAPAVLIRMKDAAEDCDGFTMLCAAMLAYLGVEQCIVTVACDGRAPTRWSHVFGMVRVGAEWVPLDCSHGVGPGWMVPRAQIYRWQAWGLDGQPMDAAPPLRSRLRGYVDRTGGRRGMGDDSVIDPLTDPNAGFTVGLLPTAVTPWGTPADPSTPAMLSDGVTPASGSGSAWANFLAVLTGQAARVATVAELPAGSTMLPNGTIVGSGQSIGGINSNSLLMIGGLLLVGVIAMSALGGRK